MWNKSFTVLRVLCHISHTCSRSLLERECEWLRLPYQFSTSSPSSDCFRSSLARTEQKTHLSVTMITQDNVKRNYSQDIKLYNNHHDIYISPIFPSSWLPSVKHMRLYGCGEFSLFSQLDPPPHSPPFFLWWFNTFVIELWLACYLFSCGLPFSRLQWFVRVCAQFSMWSFFSCLSPLSSLHYLLMISSITLWQLQLYFLLTLSNILE